MAKKPTYKELEQRVKELEQANKEMFCIDVNLSERKQTEEELRVSEEKYRLLADNVADVIWTCDMNLNMTYISPSTKKLTGFTIQEAKDVHISERMKPSSVEKINNAFMEELTLEDQGDADPSRSRSLEIEMICKDTSTIWAEVTMNFIRNDDGKAVGVLGITRDITERKQAEEKLMKLYEKLEERVEERTQDLAEANIALKVLLKKRGEDQVETEEKILANVNELIIPLINTMKGTKLDERQSTWLEIMKANLRDIVSPFSRALSSKYWRLTPTELQIANFVRNGKTTKEISKLLCVATSTINTHRDNIRKKLEIKNRNINLKTYLSDLESF